MAIKYLDAKRLQGTNAERLALTIGVGLGSAGNGTNDGATRVSDSAGANLGTYSWEFDRSADDTVTTGLTQNLGQQFSLAFWAKFENVDGWDSGCMMGKGISDGDEEFITYLDGNSYIGGEAIEDRSMPSGVVPTQSEWYHVVFTIDGDGSGEYKTYIDGVLKNTNTGARTNNEIETAFVIGDTHMAAGGWSNGSFDGKLSQTLVYNDVLTLAEVEALFNGSGHGNGAGDATPNTSGLLVWYDYQDLSSGALTNKATPVYPSLPNGTIFNETDTYKYFMWDGTDTWNQMVSS